MPSATRLPLLALALMALLRWARLAFAAAPASDAEGKGGEEAQPWQRLAGCGAAAGFLLAALLAPRPRPPPEEGKKAKRLDYFEEVQVEAGGWQEETDGNWQRATVAPSSIFHGLHYTFRELREALPRLAAEGFDAVQLPPAQKSRPGHLRREWYFRYQPVSYSELDEALGGERGLTELCAEAARQGLMVIADCVFNHMAVVASRNEWESAQRDPSLLEKLKQRLDTAFGPDLDRNDFQWPWVCLEGQKWDDPRFQYEGWGCGEWSELAGASAKVLELQTKHLDTLLACGVTGFRLDAAKHMRPEQVQHYVDFVRQQGAFVYVEVLSMQREVHSQYEALGGECMPVLSTDFATAAQLRAVLRGENRAALLPALTSLVRPAAEAVRFVRNHDTVLNGPEAICGIDWQSAEESQAAWAFLLSLPGAPVLVYSEDREQPLVQRAVRFRQLLARRFEELRRRGCGGKLGHGSCGQVRLTAWPPPDYSLILMAPTDVAGHALGLAALNFGKRAVPLHLPPQFRNVALREVQGGKERAPELGEVLRASPAMAVQPNSARFFLLTEDTQEPGFAVEVLTLFYFSGWQRPHVHFGLRDQWTQVPGWPMVASPPPAGLQKQGHGRWWRVDVPLPEGQCSVEFVLNDGSGHESARCWDNDPEGQNYLVPRAGTYILDSGKLVRLGGKA